MSSGSGLDRREALRNACVSDLQAADFAAFTAVVQTDWIGHVALAGMP
jgi:hypothetical protein